MKKLLSQIGCMILLVAFAAPCAGAASWEDEKEEWKKFSSTRFYKDPGYAAKLSLAFLPVDNGHFYVGEVGKGVWFSVGETVALAAVAVPFFNSQSRAKEEKDPLWSTGMIATAAFGGVSYIALKVWSAFDAAEGARRYNKQQEEYFKDKEQGVRLQLTPSGVRFVKTWGK
ncbi:MAG: hypothetical protein HY548_05850 [Elusimicrobia bacterium]|nr:hypothetical protein [Elusimicrobiota bacterium]